VILRHDFRCDTDDEYSCSAVILRHYRSYS
jgi:hypothetical protein